MRNLELYAVILLVVLSSCSNSLDLVDPIDPIPVVYFQMNPDDSLFYLTLTRTFSGEGSAYDLATNSNQVFYGSADISLEAWSNQYKIGETHFKLSDQIKNPGIFPQGPGYCYESANEFQFLDLTTSFRLVIKLPGTSTPVFSRIPFISGSVQLIPSRFETRIDLYPDNYPLLFEIDRDVEYCELLCVFHYQEYEGTWVDHSVTFLLRRDIMIKGIVASTFLYPDLFFTKLTKNITPINDTILRKFISLDLIFLTGDQFFNDYIDTYIKGLNQDLPPICNIEYGYGLFTMMRSFRINKMTLGYQTHDSLCNGEIARKLGFVRW